MDGQHRFIASQKTIKEDSNRLSMGKSIEDSKLMFLECSVNESTLSELVAIANYAAKAWTSKDYLVGASMDSDDEALQFAAGLTKCGYSPSTISLILYNAEKKLDSHSLKRAFEDKALNHNGLDLERAKRFIEESRKKFEDTTIKKGFFVQYFLNNIDKIRKLIEDDIQKVKKAKKSNFDKILKEIK